MNTIIIILLAIIVVELYLLLDKMFQTRNLLENIWQGLFNNKYSSGLEIFNKIIKDKEDDGVPAIGIDFDGTICKKQQESERLLKEIAKSLKEQQDVFDRNGIDFSIAKHWKTTTDSLKEKSVANTKLTQQEILDEGTSDMIIRTLERGLKKQEDLKKIYPKYNDKLSYNVNLKNYNKSNLG